MGAIRAAAVLTIFAGPALADPAEIPPDEIRAAVEAAFRATAPAAARLEIVSIPALRHDGTAPAIVVALPDPLDTPGPRDIDVSCRVREREVSRGVASVVVRIKRPVWVAERDLARDEVLDLSALRRELREFDRPPPPLFRPEPGVRFRLVRDVEAGDALRVDDVLRIPGHESGPDHARASATTPPAGRSG